MQAQDTAEIFSTKSCYREYTRRRCTVAILPWVLQVSGQGCVSGQTTSMGSQPSCCSGSNTAHASEGCHTCRRLSTSKTDPGNASHSNDCQSWCQPIIAGAVRHSTLLQPTSQPLGKLPCTRGRRHLQSFHQTLLGFQDHVSSRCGLPRAVRRCEGDILHSRWIPAHCGCAGAAVLSHVAHVLHRDAVHRATFAAQCHLSLSTISRVLSGQPRRNAVQYGRMRAWLYRQDQQWVERALQVVGEGMPAQDAVEEEEWKEWKALTLALDRRAEIDRLLIPSLTPSASPQSSTDAMEVDGDGADGADGAEMDDDADSNGHDAASLLETKAPAPSRRVKGGRTRRASLSRDSSASSAASVDGGASAGAASGLPASYLNSPPDDVAERVDFFLTQLRLSQKQLAALCGLPLSTLSQVVRRVYKPWPDDASPPLYAAPSPFLALLSFLHAVDGALAGLVRPRLSEVHDADNLRFLSSLTVSGISRDRLNVWMDAKTANPMQDRQWIDQIASKSSESRRRPSSGSGERTKAKEEQPEGDG